MLIHEMTEPFDQPVPEASRSAEPPRYDSAELFRGARVVLIDHAGEQYRLLVTRNDRLILQK